MDSSEPINDETPAHAGVSGEALHRTRTGDPFLTMDGSTSQPVTPGHSEAPDATPQEALEDPDRPPERPQDAPTSVFVGVRDFAVQVGRMALVMPPIGGGGGVNVVDLFAGPGGWDLAAHALDLEPLGIEWDVAACATREAAGLRTLQGDVAALDPAAIVAEHMGGRLDGLIASPPCQAFSMAGKGVGRRGLTAYLEAIENWIDGTPPDRVELDRVCDDERGHLVLEPLRWTLALRPRWIALEQVEPVLPLWASMAVALRRLGYQTWAGVLSAERYGVPQTRKRAIMLASLDQPVSEPPAPHQRYIAPRRRDEATESLFAAPDPERIVLREEEHLQPWVSMAEALGWGMTARPYLAIACSRSTGGPDKEKVGGSSARAVRCRTARPGIVGQARSSGANAGGGSGGVGRSGGIEWASNDRPNAARRRADEPAPTITGGHDHQDRRWEVGPPTHLDRRQTGGDGTPVKPRPVTEPAPTMTSNGLAKGRDVWTDSAEPLSSSVDAPAPTGSQQANAVSVTLAEALVLQSFPPDYPVQGTKSKQFAQVGNAVPPLLAWHVLRAVLPAAAALEEVA